METYKPSEALLADMASKGIDSQLTLSLLSDWNEGLYDEVKAVEASGVPSVDGRTVVDMGPALSYEISAEEARERLASVQLRIPASASISGGKARFNRASLREIGSSLLPRTAYGVLNGGSATSYADAKKNLAFGTEVFAALASWFHELEPLCKDRPKGLTPAYINPDGSPGESFLVLKMRARLLSAKHHGSHNGGKPFMPLFQMSSTGNDAELAAAYATMRDHPFLAGLSKTTGLAPSDWESGVQPMIAAYSHSSEGRPKKIFDKAWGRANSSLPLPGGHGQCFRVLASTLRALHERGARFAYLGNVDNIGYLPDPVEIAVLALSGLPAGFDFARRTEIDVKGGILVETKEGGRTVADIGPAISFDEVKKLESGGASILFNCATGLFDLDWLLPRIDDLGRKLPLRFTDQDKDSGRYSQAEQVTWEITGMLPGFVAFAVDKYERFIAAKLLAETLLTSGMGFGDSRLPHTLAETAARLRAGLERKLAGAYGLELKKGRWIPEELG